MGTIDDTSSSPEENETAANVAIYRMRREERLSSQAEGALGCGCPYRSAESAV
jgi:hypothetical protein